MCVAWSESLPLPLLLEVPLPRLERPRRRDFFLSFRLRNQYAVPTTANTAEA